MIQDIKNSHTRISPEAFVHPRATIIGDVIIKKDASIWPGAILRGDMGSIVIGERSSIQDGTIGHMTKDYSNLVIGSDVTVGHMVMLHGCIVEDDCLIGMGSILLDNAIIKKGSFIAAGSLITGEKQFPPGSFIVGRPAKAIRLVNDKEKLMMKASIDHYQKVIKDYQASLLG